MCMARHAIAHSSLASVAGTSSMLRAVRLGPVGQLLRGARIAQKPALPVGHLRNVRAMANERAAADAAAPLADTEPPTIFDKIARKEIPANIIYEDDEVLAFRDISPCTPVHFLVIPKRDTLKSIYATGPCVVTATQVRDGLTRLSKANESHKMLLGQLLYVAQKVALQEGLGEGFRVVINDGPNGCQSVYHLHLHVMGGQKLGWPPGVN